MWFFQGEPGFFNWTQIILTKILMLQSLCLSFIYNPLNQHKKENIKGKLSALSSLLGYLLSEYLHLLFWYSTPIKLKASFQFLWVCLRLGFVSTLFDCFKDFHDKGCRCSWSELVSSDFGTGITVDVFHILDMLPPSAHLWESAERISVSWLAQ